MVPFLIQLVGSLVEVAGGHLVGRLTSGSVNRRRWRARIAKQVAKAEIDRIRDHEGVERVLTDPEVWLASQQGDARRLEQRAKDLRGFVRGESDEERDDNCRVVLAAFVLRVSTSLQFSERTLLEILAAVEAVREAQEEATTAHQDRLSRTLRIDEVLERVAQTHDDVVRAHHDPGDPWPLTHFERAVATQLDEVVAPLLGETVTKDELLFVRLVLLHVDIVLREAASTRLQRLRDSYLRTPADERSPVGRDLSLAVREAPELFRRLGRLTGTGSSDADALQHWLAHRAVLLSPELWHEGEHWARAQRVAQFLEVRPANRGRVADLVAKAARYAVYEDDPVAGMRRLPDDEHHVRPPGDGPTLRLRWRVVMAVTRFSWYLLADPRVFGLGLAEQLGVVTPFQLTEAVEDLTGVSWAYARRGRRLGLDGPCRHAATADALENLVKHVRRELDALREAIGPDTVLPVRIEGGIAPSIVDGGRAFELPLVRLHLSDKEIRRHLMGETLYGDPELAIRELYQNALDACRYRRMRAHLRRERGALGEDYVPVVKISQRVEGDHLVIDCVDNGVGMSPVELQGAFVRAGRRFTDLRSFWDEEADWRRHTPALTFRPTSRFGIGAFSYFMLADEVIVDSVRQRPDGACEAPLHAQISGLSGLVTMSRPVDLPELSSGGTRVTLRVPLHEGIEPRVGATVDELRSISVVEKLERLVWYSDVELVVEQDGRDPAHWTPGHMRQPGPTGRAFDTNGCRGWWTRGNGRLLADGIATVVELEGVVVDLHGDEVLRLQADRNEVLFWDQDWVSEQLQAAAMTAVEWDDLTLDWLWRLSLHWPRVGQRIFRLAIDADRRIPIGVGPDPTAMVRLREVGCFPGDLRCLAGAGERRALPISSPLPASLRFARSDLFESDPRTRGWAETVWPWRRAVLAEAGLPVISRLLDERHAPRSLAGHPLMDPLSAALVHELQPPSLGRGKEMSPVEPWGLVVGASRTGLDLGRAIGRVRRLHTTGYLAPTVDARCTRDWSPERTGPEVVQLLTAAAENMRHGESSAEVWTVCLLAVANERRRRLDHFAPALGLLCELGVTGVPNLDPRAGERVPTLRDVAVLCRPLGGLRLWELIERAEVTDPSGFRRLHEQLMPYSALLAQVGTTVGHLRRLADEWPSREQSVAWSQNANGGGPWLYGAVASLGHIARVALDLNIDLTAARALVIEGPAVQLDAGAEGALPAERLPEPLGALLADALSPGRSNYGLLDDERFVALAREQGLDPADAAAFLREQVTQARSTIPRPEDLLRERSDPDEEPEHVEVEPGTGRPQVFLERMDPVRSLASHLVEAGAEWPSVLERIRIDTASLNRRYQLTDEDPLLEALARVESPDSPAPLDPLLSDVATRLERVARSCAGVSRAHVVEVAGMFGIAPRDVFEMIQPFEPILGLYGRVPVAFDDDAADKVPDWLDVAVVSLLVAQGPKRRNSPRRHRLGRWTAETRDYLAGNLDLEPGDIEFDALEDRYRRWVRVLADDPNADCVRPADSSGFRDRNVSGMVLWPGF